MEVGVRESRQRAQSLIQLTTILWNNKGSLNLDSCFSEISHKALCGSEERKVLFQVYERKNLWNAGILTNTNRSVSNSECGPVCDLKIVAEVSKNGRCYPTISTGRPRFTTPRQDRYLVISARRQRGSTGRALRSALTVATEIRISRQTVYRRLNHAGLYARRPAVCIPLTSAHKRARLNWCLKHQH
ncbi:transposable element Tcb2 transposase [Trichonephila clavipes]|nr:transposable element Tcb2 transposase [Trichonephila clavipes]